MHWHAAGGALAIVDGETVVAVLGHNPKEQHRETWFVGTEAFFQSRFVRPAKSIMRDLIDANPEVAFRSSSPLDRPEVGKWFGLLGFREIGASQNAYGVERVYEIRSTSAENGEGPGVRLRKTAE